MKPSASSLVNSSRQVSSSDSAATDYELSVIDFDEDNFVTQFDKDNQHRKNGKVQTFRLGSGDLALRIYNKCAEIEESSAKTWFYDIWGVDKNVWRFEWQVRKAWLRQLGIITFQDLSERQGDLLRVLVQDHTSLRIKGKDSNRSRWRLHPVWKDLRAFVRELDGLGVIRDLGMPRLLSERMQRIAISLYGYMKTIAAIQSVAANVPAISLNEARAHLALELKQLHDPLTWETDVERRMKELKLGEW